MRRVRVHGAPLGLDDALRLAALHLRHPAPSTYDGLDALLSVCLGTVPGAVAAAVSTAGHGWVHSTHATDPAIRDVDAWHDRLGRGPLLDEAGDGVPALAVLLVEDLAFDVDDGAVRVRVAPFQALHSTTLRCRDGRRTALDLYAAEPGVLGVDTTVLADMFARRAISLLYGTGEPLDGRRRLAVRLLERALGLSRPEAELLLRPHLRRDGADPVLLAEGLVDHLDGSRERS